MQSTVLQKITPHNSSHVMAFAEDVRKGLTSTPKKLSTKFFYNQAGDLLFQRMMELDGYYPTRCEFEIVRTYQDAFWQLFHSDKRPFRLFDFGVENGVKTKVLLDHFAQQGQAFQYVPIDISQNILDVVEADFSSSYPQLDMQPFCGDYFEALSCLKDTNYRRVVLFMGSNIGNFEEADAVDFLQRVQAILSAGDLFLVGIDLKKDGCDRSIPKVLCRLFPILSAFDHVHLGDGQRF